MGFQQDFLETARVSAEDAAALVAKRMDELKESPESLSIIGAFTHVVENDLKDVAYILYSGNDRMVVTREQPSYVDRAMDLVLENVMTTLFTNSAPAATP